jgi:magnesium transporter
VITSCFRHGDSDVRLDLPFDQLRDALGYSEGLLWVDVHGEDRAEGERVLRDVFDFHQLTIDDCYNDLIDPPKVDDYGPYLFVIVHAIRYDSPTLELTTEELDLYIGANYVVSFHKTPLGAVDEVRRRAEGRSLVLDHGPAFLAHALLDVVVDEFHPVVEALDDQVSDLEERVLDTPERALLQQALQLKRNAQRMRRTIFPQRDVANRFARGEYRLVAGDALMYFRDIYDHTVRVEEMIEGVRDLADSALNTYLSSVNNRLNEVMKTLAIVSVVFLPLTLVASVYGTNFHRTFPSYGWEPGFFGMILSFGAIAVALIYWFRLRGWI